MRTTTNTNPEKTALLKTEEVNSFIDQSEQLEKDFPWLVGNDPFQESMKAILLQEENEWFVDLMLSNPLPHRYQVKSHQTLAITFSSFCAAALYLFYFKGSQSDGTRNVAAAMIVNTIQNLLYGVETYFFLKNPGDTLNLVLGLLLSGGATGASALSAYQLSHDPLTTVLTAAGNFPMNTFGMANTIKGLRQMMDQNPDLRQFWLDKLSNVAVKLNEPVLELCLKDSKRNLCTKITGVGLGLGLGVIMGGSMAGYIYSSFLAALTFSSKGGSIAISVISNAPTVLIAVFQSGIGLGKKIVNKLADALTFLAAKQKINLTPRQAYFLSLNLISVAFVGYWAYYSNSTSKTLAKDIPPFNQYLNAFIDFCVENGTSLFNGIMSAISLNAIINYFNVAYDNNVRNQAKEQFSQIKSWLDNASATELSGLSRKFNMWPRKNSLDLPAPKNDGYQRLDEVVVAKP